MSEARVNSTAYPIQRKEAASPLLHESIKDEIKWRRQFLSVLELPSIMDAVADEQAFSDLLHYAIENRLIRQSALAEKIKYANSQIGRWAAGKASPPLVVRRVVIEEIRGLLSESLTKRQKLVS
ncbi:MAG: hypothetical protein GXP06_07860 [Alphaproteobacteria bacterium]|nr:hypothetical protein [Alphaproteobacteria bacterium]